MRITFVAILFTLLAFVGVSTPSLASGSQCAQDCNVGPQVRRATTTQLVCIDFKQRTPGPVRLTIHRSGKDPVVTEADHSETGDFCRGRHYFRSATKVELCNGEITRFIEGDRIEAELLHLSGQQVYPLRENPVQLWRE